MRNRCKRTLSIVLCILLMMSNLLAVEANSIPKLKDISGNKYEKILVEWVEKGYIKGFPDGTFRPNVTVSRAQFMALTNRAYGFTDAANIKFTDVKKTDWFYNDVAIAFKTGYMIGFNGKAQPLDLISRQEIAVMAARIGKLDTTVNNEALKGLKDAGSFPDWSKGAISAAMSKKLFDGFVTDKFNATQKITRLEAVVVLDRLINMTDLVEEPVETKPSIAGAVISIEGLVKVDNTSFTASQAIDSQYSLPAAAQFTLPDGRVLTRSISWTPNIVNTSASGTSIITGTIEEYGEITLTLTITPAVIDTSVVVTPPAIVTPTAAPPVDNTPPVVNPPQPPADNTPPTIAVNQLTTEEGVIKTDQTKFTLTGTASDSSGVSGVFCSYRHVTSEQGATNPVVGTENWTTVDIPLQIGSTHVQITATDTRGNIATKNFVINRISTEITLSDAIRAFEVESEEGLREVSDIYDSIVDFWTDDMDTPGDPEDDELVILVTEENPLLTRFRNDEFSIGNMILIPPCEKFVKGFMAIMLGSSEPTDLDNYPAEGYELLRTRLPGIADYFDGNVSIDISDSIDPENPIAFALLPQGSEIYSETPSGRQLLAVSSAVMYSDSPEPAVYRSGFQYNNIVRLAKPTADFNLNKSLLFKFPETVIYDYDGDQTRDSSGNKRVTENDRITVSGEMGMKNIAAKVGLEWHPSLADILPQQFICKLSYDNVKELKFKAGAGVDMSTLVEQFNKAVTGGFENKTQFMGASIDGVDMKDTIVLGAVGFNVATGFAPQVATVRTIQSGSVLVPFNPILVVMLVLDINGELRTEVTFDFSSTSYVEKGFNVQKDGFIGGYGSLNSNRGQRSIDLPFNRTLEIYDIEAKSKTELGSKPTTKLKITASGKANESVGFGPMIGFMMCGVTPATIKATGYEQAEVNLEGSITLETGQSPKLEGSASATVEAGVRVKTSLKLKAKTPLGSYSLTYAPEPWVYKLLEFTITTTGLNGRITKADTDRNPFNNPPLSGVLIELRKNNLVNAETYRVYTEANGDFSFGNKAAGSYTLTCSKAGFVTFKDENVEISSSNNSYPVVMDVDSQCGLSGKVTIADEDTNMANNLPLPGVAVTARKIGASSNLVKTAVTDSTGSYTIESLTPGLYNVTFMKSEYLEISQDIIIREGESAVYNATLEAILEVYGGNGDAAGRIINALTGQGVESGISLIVRRGYDNLADETIVTTALTGLNGLYKLTLPAGNYCVEIVDDRIVEEDMIRYQNGSFNIKVLGGITISNQNGVVTPLLPEGQIRIVLRWGESPRDLDSHLTGPTADLSDRFHIYYSNKTYSFPENGSYVKYADLDLDDTTSWGPETTTIYKQSEGVYNFFVHDYTNRSASSSMSLADSGAYVEVYMGNEPRAVAVYYVPQQEGTLWAVFSYNSVTKEITAINTITYSSTSGINAGESITGLSDNLSDAGCMEADIKRIGISVLQEKE